MHLNLEQNLLPQLQLGSIIGFILDNWFGTKPLLIIIFFFLVLQLEFKCNKSSKKNAKGIKYGNKPDASVKCLQNWT